jgi:hydrogenase maturation protease
LRRFKPSQGFHYGKIHIMKIIVLGIGQSLRGDDAAGLEAVRLWQERFTDTAQKVHVGLSELPGLSLLDMLGGMEAAILVDAVHSSAKPGTLYHLGPEELASFTPGSASAHGWGVAETLALGRSLYPALANTRVTLIGIVGKNFNMGTGLSPEVLAVLEDAAEMIEKEIQS